MTGYLRVVGWEEFQHYRDRDPVWIKLHRGLLDNYQWSRLQDASKSHLIGIWLLAARHANRIPADPEWIGKRIGATDKVDLQVLVAGGFVELEQPASGTLAICLPREREETEGEKRRDREETAPRFADPSHQQAYDGFLKAARSPDAVRASIAAVALGMPGHGAAYGWPVVGQALQELLAAGSTFSPQGLRAFAKKIAERGGSPGGTPRLRELA